MLVNLLLFQTGGQCTLAVEQADGWLGATWTSASTSQTRSVSGATDYPGPTEPFPGPYLLNDNEALRRRTWLDSSEWLECAWLFQALRLGLRWVAHVQATSSTGVQPRKYSRHVAGALEVRLFHTVPEAKERLRRRQRVAGQQQRVA